MVKYQRPRGTKDILPGETEKWQYIEDTARMLFQDYRYREIRTPMIENYHVFSRSSGDTSDIVSKEMYDFHDKGGRHIALRPEGTAGVVRAFIQNKLYGPDTPKPYKVYYMGPMFRYEHPQSGREREFHQIGVESFGSKSAEMDVEVIAMAMDLLHQYGLKHLHLALNTLGDRKTKDTYCKALIKYLEPHFNELSEDSQKRMHKNPLRVLDSKDPRDKKFVAGAPSILDYLTPEAKAHFDRVKQLLDALGIKYYVSPDVVRGLDYYNHTIFEIMVKSSAFGNGFTTVCAGGRYNKLVHQLGGPEVPGIGFGLGVERLILVMKSKHLPFPKANPLDAFVVNIGDKADIASLKLVQDLRNQGISTDRDYTGRKPGSQFKMANKLDAHYTLTIGDKELKNNSVSIKSMDSGKQVTVPLDKVAKHFSDVVNKDFDE
ncbi:histidine--tRNA ligase [Acetilactobacillus jinshanensis]|uniref:Histidine--tRNA ligase n=1 Tax=Acetilactobacillus jinshanensis TaxID=1720083 RepID=A0A4P6ZK01_9LACO|nr:histidine--tRNA ligase [Acetilactobacillus jinshanensis]QBP17974.1 histidine--tRNA ligase [Acetilactobacillus jinshanensis]URL60836.1 histidine--tRNA ligase [uncultured bacterium]